MDGGRRESGSIQSGLSCCGRQFVDVKKCSVAVYAPPHAKVQLLSSSFQTLVYDQMGHLVESGHVPQRVVSPRAARRVANLVVSTHAGAVSAAAAGRSLGR